MQAAHRPIRAAHCSCRRRPAATSRRRTSAPAPRPPQVLGVPRNADSISIQRAYRKKVAELKGRDDAAVQRIEAAHSAIMMSALTSRLKVPAVAAPAPAAGCARAVPLRQAASSTLQAGQPVRRRC